MQTYDIAKVSKIFVHSEAFQTTFWIKTRSTRICNIVTLNTAPMTGKSSLH